MNLEAAKAVLQGLASRVDPATADSLRELEAFLVVRDFEVEALKEQLRRMVYERAGLQVNEDRAH